eukprot:scaffold5585_cov57-Attheya_sp.AAC.10
MDGSDNNPIDDEDNKLNVNVSDVTVQHHYVLDPWILKLAGVSQELWRIQDCASDLIVLKLSSGDTLEKINLVENVSAGSKADF